MYQVPLSLVSMRAFQPLYQHVRAECTQLPGCCIESGGIAAAERNLGAGPRLLKRNRVPDAPAGARDECNLTLEQAIAERQRHAASSSSERPN
jgi:hypothetical protein